MYKRKDGLYEVSVTINGKRKYFRGKSPQIVYRKVAEYKYETETGKTFARITDAWIEECSVSESTFVTYERYARHWTDCFGENHIADITPKSIQNAVKIYAVNHSYKTVSNCLSVLRLIFEFAIVKGYASDNPAEHVTIPKGLSRRRRRFPDESDREVVEKNRDSYIGRVFFTALYTGLRKGELFALQWRDIDFDNGIIHVTKSVKWRSNVPEIGTTKTENGIRDTIQLFDVSDLLKPIISAPDEFVFAVDGRIPHESYITRRIKEYQMHTGIDLTLHEMRHGFATICFSKGVDAKSVQHLLGHAQSSTTLDIYTHWQRKSLEKVREMLEK